MNLTSFTCTKKAEKGFKGFYWYGDKCKLREI